MGWLDEASNGYMAPNLISGSTEMGNPFNARNFSFLYYLWLNSPIRVHIYWWCHSYIHLVTASRNAGQRFSVTPYITPRLTPTATPKVISIGGSPRYSVAGSPQMTSGATSPTKSRFEGRGTLSSWYPSSQQSSAASSPPHGRAVPGSQHHHILPHISIGNIDMKKCNLFEDLKLDKSEWRNKIHVANPNIVETWLWWWWDDDDFYQYHETLLKKNF